ncbi:MAG: hypothetical protein DLM53_12625 [Candidatus Eremiobacter antarcticus]|nr:SpoIID/LytB domain-containing protein [Candidatus Eremiobacteraeota bacterium]PZR60490.1 MAG: hypothetical protein DLM53_12625 [Candidatus Eremiobacter sp. RRmetagenome_bin22]
MRHKPALCAVLVLAALAVLAPCLARAARPNAFVRVLILDHQLQTVVASAGGLIVRPLQPDSSPLLAPEITTVVDVQPKIEGLLIAGSVEAPDKISITPLTDLGLTVNGLSYRGSITVDREHENSISVINALQLEQYLYSVVGSEIGANTPSAALQAQAIAARTYAVAHLGNHEDLGFDLRAGDQDQAYNGVVAESMPVVDAVDATRGVVMIYRGHVAQAYYSACDGGFTSDGNALSDPQPYLQAVKDPYCPLSPYMRWSAAVPVSEFLAAANARSVFQPPLSADAFRGIRAGSADASGRLQSVIIDTAQGPFTMPGTMFRRLAGTRLIKSTRISALSSQAGVIRASGAGFGHGVGMCQLGARGMADAGLGVYAIIDFYYPGVLLTQLASAGHLHVAFNSTRAPNLAAF